MATYLGWNNLAPKSSPTFGIGNATDDSISPMVNVLDPRPQKIGRFNFASQPSGNPYTLLDYPSTASVSPVRVIAALNCRISPQNSARVQLQTLVNVPVGLNDFISFGNTAPIPNSPDRFNLFGVSSSAVTTGQRVVLAPEGWAGNASGFMEVGTLWLSDAVVMDEGSDPDWQIDIIDDSDVYRSKGGAFSSTPVMTRRKLSMSFSSRTFGKMLFNGADRTGNTMLKFLREAGIGTRVMAVQRHEDYQTKQISSVYGAITRLPAIIHAGGNQFSLSGKLEIEEIP